MATILECSPKGDVKYDMPDYIFDAIQNLTKLKYYKSVKEIVRHLPENMRESIKIEKIKKKKNVSGIRADYVFYDEVSL